MTGRWLLAAFHLLALGLGLGAVWVRARALGRPLVPENLRRAFAADALWGVAGFLWIVTGLWRLFAGTEKPAAYYMTNHVFWTKMGLLLVIILLESWAAVTLTRWRRLAARNEPIDAGRARAMATISYVEAGIVVLMVLAASAMARGIG